jgi:hypothetical protein
MLALDDAVLPNTGLIFYDRAYAFPHFLIHAPSPIYSDEGWPVRSCIAGELRRHASLKLSKLSPSLEGRASPSRACLLSR